MKISKRIYRVESSSPLLVLKDLTTDKEYTINKPYKLAVGTLVVGLLSEYSGILNFKVTYDSESHALIANYKKWQDFVRLFGKILDVDMIKAEYNTPDEFYSELLDSSEDKLATLPPNLKSVYDTLFKLHTKTIKKYLNIIITCAEGVKYLTLIKQALNDIAVNIQFISGVKFVITYDYAPTSKLNTKVIEKTILSVSKDIKLNWYDNRN